MSVLANLINQRQRWSIQQIEHAAFMYKLRQAAESVVLMILGVLLVYYHREVLLLVKSILNR